MSGTTGAATQSRPPAVRVMRNLGLEPDPWQVEVLEGGHRRLLLDPVDQQTVKDPDLGRGQPDSQSVAHQRAHLADLVP